MAALAITGRRQNLAAEAISAIIAATETWQNYAGKYHHNMAQHRGKYLSCHLLVLQILFNKRSWNEVQMGAVNPHCLHLKQDNNSNRLDGGYTSYWLLYT